jgi:hypothetical protein
MEAFLTRPGGNNFASTGLTEYLARGLCRSLLTTRLYVYLLEFRILVRTFNYPDPKDQPHHPRDAKSFTFRAPISP